MSPILDQLIFESIAERIQTPADLQKLKNKYCQTHQFKTILNIDLLETYKQLLNKKIIQENRHLLSLLKKRGVRTMSGISPVTVMLKPYACPGKCIFCPTEPMMPKSYLSNEPAVMRAIMNKWDGFEQIQNRLRSLQITGHAIEKNELIVSGGTWSFYPKRYQTAFIKACYDGFNVFEQIKDKITYTSLESGQFAKFKTLKMKVKRSKTLAEAKKINETTLCRVIGMSLETRPDFIDEKEVIRMRKLGCTRVQMGAQSLYDDVLDINKRGHGIKETAQATKLLKDAGFKVDYHMMPNLLGSTVEKDIAMFPELFANPAYQPDQLKIYPCSVVPYSVLEKVYKRGEYQAYSEEDLFRILYTVKKSIPPYVRISRLIRDIPSTSILTGNKSTNLRQLVLEKMALNGEKCRCIRCREVRDKDVSDLKPELVTREYDASDGKEIFFSFEDTTADLLFGFCRLRIPSQFFSGRKHFIPELEGAALIRELHVYGIQVPIDSHEDDAVQHFGFGRKLMQIAEEYIRQRGIRKVAVIAGTGVRAYYRKLGYELEGEYMLKQV